MDLGELKNLLEEHRIPFHEWGREGGKTLDDLHREINEEESGLTVVDGSLQRHLECIAVDVFYLDGAKKRRLAESHQLVDGVRRTRERTHSICEKRKGNETVLLSAHRALSEELGVKGSLDFLEQGVVRETRESRSFTGLQTFYIIYTFELFLPEKWYLPEGYVDTSEAPDEITYFVWE